MKKLTEPQKKLMQALAKPNTYLTKETVPHPDKRIDRTIDRYSIISNGKRENLKSSSVPHSLLTHKIIKEVNGKFILNNLSKKLNLSDFSKVQLETLFEIYTEQLKTGTVYIDKEKTEYIYYKKSKNIVIGIPNRTANSIISKKGFVREGTRLVLSNELIAIFDKKVSEQENKTHSRQLDFEKSLEEIYLSKNYSSNERRLIFTMEKLIERNKENNEFFLIHHTKYDINIFKANIENYQLELSDFSREGSTVRYSQKIVHNLQPTNENCKRALDYVKGKGLIKPFSQLIDKDFYVIAE